MTSAYLHWGQSYFSAGAQFQTLVVIQVSIQSRLDPETFSDTDNSFIAVFMTVLIVLVVVVGVLMFVAAVRAEQYKISRERDNQGLTGAFRVFKGNAQSSKNYRRSSQMRNSMMRGSILRASQASRASATMEMRRRPPEVTSSSSSSSSPSSLSSSSSSSRKLQVAGSSAGSDRSLGGAEHGADDTLGFGRDMIAHQETNDRRSTLGANPMLAHSLLPTSLEPPGPPE